MANFFKESRGFAARNRQLFDFIHTSSVALWNLRWQVQGFLGVRPDASREELSSRFSSGTDIRANNLKGTCVQTSWEEQLAQFAQIVSANLIAMYEGWAEELMSRLGTPQLIKQIQFPSRGYRGRSGNGISEAIASIRSAGTSVEMKRAFFPVYSRHQKYSLSHLDGLLCMYRYHKEIRNSLMHRSSIADTKAEDAWRTAATLTRADIGGRSTPCVTPITADRPVRTDIGEAIQLSDILLRIVFTIDAELCFTKAAETIFVEDWRSMNDWRNFRQLPSDPANRHLRLCAITRKAGYATPEDSEAIFEIAHRNHLIAY